MVKLREKTAPADVQRESVSKEQIEMEAYFHWLDRGCPENDALTDWVEVEKKLKDSWVAGEGDD